MSEYSQRIEALVANLTLSEKVSLLTGLDFWNTLPLERIGLRSMLLSDGPAGVRGEFWDERDNSLNLPSGTALGSSWSAELSYQYGQTLASEAERKGVDVVLGPTINLHRSPFGGRHFECLSEDPLLTGSLATSFVRGIQDAGIGACPKHFVANDFETERFTANVVVDERTLREVYLRPFEDTVVHGKAWTIMSAYNSVNGVTMTESNLLETPLRTEWGFDGVVISDWTAVRSLEAAKAEQDLAMPGPIGPWGDALIAAVRSGDVDESAIDRKVTRLLLLGIRVGALSEDGVAPAAKQRHNEISTSNVAFARKAAIETSVLLTNRDSILPINFDNLGRIALIGNNALLARTQGGGSATVMPKTVVSPVEALGNILGEKLTYSIGAVVQHGLAELPRREIVNPATGEPGVLVEFLDENGHVFYTENRASTKLMWLGSGAPIEKANSLRITTDFTPNESRSELFGVANARHNRLTLNGKVILDALIPRSNLEPFSELLDPPFMTVPQDFSGGQTAQLVVEADLQNRVGFEAEAFSITLGFEANRAIGDSLIYEAVENSKNADLVIVVVGTNAAVESEGHDRQSLQLPGRQDELVEEVLKVNKNVVVVVNAGAPVLMPWRNGVKGILLTYFAGQEMGNALVDILTGAAEPGGRLPTTWPVEESSLPVSNCTPTGGQILYEEGIHIGYRAWLKSGAETAFDFGHGLGYTTWEFGEASGPAAINPDSEFEVTIPVTNTGARKGKTVVQVYASKTDSLIDRPVRWLVGFAEVLAGPAETAVANVRVRAREFAHWDKGWRYEEGHFELQIGTSVSNIFARHSLQIV
jgi:beta-glucosidase